MSSNIAEKVNPFDNSPVAARPGGSSSAGALVEQESQRAVAEVQAAIMLAKRFPRDQMAAYDRIMTACQRQALAESAIYSYSRGGSAVTGPSIRLAEALAQSWGNVQFGIRELEQRNGESTVEAFAWDVETNTRQVKVFQVSHSRYTKGGIKKLEDPRDIYEMVANQGARRLRACILGIIPGDVVEAAVDECERTMTAKADTSPEAVKKLVAAFATYGVSKEQIEKRIQRRLDAITPAQIVNMRKIYNSLKDGMSVAADWFEVVAAENGQTQPTKGVDAAKAALKKQGNTPAQEPAADAVDQSTGEVADPEPDLCPVCEKLRIDGKCMNPDCSEYEPTDADLFGGGSK